MEAEIDQAREAADGRHSRFVDHPARRAVAAAATGGGTETVVQRSKLRLGRGEAGEQRGARERAARELDA